MMLRPSLEPLEPRTLLATISTVSPADLAIGAAVNVAVRVKFGTAMNPASINSSTFVLKNGSTLVPGRIAFNGVNSTATFNATAPLQYATSYTATVMGGPGGVQDSDGGDLAADVSWSFATVASPQNGTGGPILVITSATNPFSTYYAEILRAEGLNAFDTADISTVSAGMLNSYRVAILGEVPVNAAQAGVFEDWVDDGNNLIAMRPDADLSSLLGISPIGTTLSNAYLKVDTTRAPGAGIVGETMQFHGVSDRYALNGASAIATLYSDANTPTSNPAVTINNVGIGGGQAAAFSFDLAKSIIYTRQGNPAWSGQERDGIAPIRSDDLFFGNAAFDPQPDWVDFNKIAIPQADEQQRLLVNMIERMAWDNSAPLPRFWYLPGGKKAVIVMSGDDHNNGGTAGRFNAYMLAGLAGGQTIRGTSYIFDGSVTDAQAAYYNAFGFEIAAHVAIEDAFGNPRNWVSPADLQSLYNTQLGSFATMYTSLPAPATNRTHAIVWSDYDSQPQVQFTHGIRLDASYYYWPGTWILDRPGVFTGSALPMRFAKADGSIIDVFQLATQLTDESQQTYPENVDTLLDRALGPEAYYGAYTVNAHTDEVLSAESNAVIASAKARNVPVMSAQQIAQFADGRSGSSFSAIDWDGARQRLSFELARADGANGLQAMLPTTAAGDQMLDDITRNGVPVPFTREVIKGIEYAFFDAAAGAYVAEYSIDQEAPQVTSRAPQTGGALITSKVTATFSEPVRGETISLVLRDPELQVVAGNLAYDPATRTASFTPNALLSPDTTYSVTVAGAVDERGNTLTEPDDWSFTTAGTGPFTIFSDSLTPQKPNDPDAQAIEVGVKFRSEISGYITGVRFYKGNQNTGTHVGSLWSAGGLLLAQATFTNETTSGWQYVNFSSPVAIIANTTYVVSYHTEVGHYSSSAAFFNSGFDSGYLHALKSVAGNGNGVFAYGAGGFPTNSFGAANYWVDVGFQMALDTTPPSVAAHSPVSGAIGVAPNAGVTVTFTEAIQPATLSFTLRDHDSNLVNAVVTYDPATRRALLIASTNLTPFQTYSATVSDARDFTGNVMASPFSWSFTVGKLLGPNPKPPAAGTNVPPIKDLIDELDDDLIWLV